MRNISSQASDLVKYYQLSDFDIFSKRPLKQADMFSFCLVFGRLLVLHLIRRLIDSYKITLKARLPAVFKTLL